jgi:SCP1.201-like deaminase
MPFDSSDDDTWWPNHWPPRMDPAGGSSYPYDWTDPFINSRAATLNPVASAPAPFSAAQLGAMAWHPPIFLNGPSTFVPSNLPATAWPQQPFPPAGPNAGPGFVDAPAWPPQSIPAPFAGPPFDVSVRDAAVPTTLGTPGATHTLGLPPRPPLARFASLAAARAIDAPWGLLPPDPSLRFGLFGPDPDSTSPIAGLSLSVRDAAVPTTLGTPGATYTLGLPPRPPLAQFASLAATRAIDASWGLLPRDPSLRFGPFGPDPDSTSPIAGPPLSVRDAAVPTTLGTPGATYTLGFPPRFPPLAQFQSPVDSSAPALDPSNGLPVGALGAPAAAPPRSVLFNHPPAPWDLDAHDRDLTDLDQSAQGLGISELPISKSGEPLVPPRPQLSTAQEQALYAARTWSPNLVDYFSKTLPPTPPFPSIPGKIPGLDNPYALGAAFEVATWLLAGADRGIFGPLEGIARTAERSVPETASGRIAAALRAAVDSGNLTEEQAAVLRLRANVAISGGTTGLKIPISPWLPGYDRETTYGVLITNEGNVVPLRSGPPRSFKNYPPSKHVEGKAAIRIRENGSSGGVVFHNNTGGTCGLCDAQLERLLPETAQLDVVPPTGGVPKNSNAVAEPTFYVGDDVLPKPPRSIRKPNSFGKLP